VHSEPLLLLLLLLCAAIGVFDTQGIDVASRKKATLPKQTKEKAEGEQKTSELVLVDWRECSRRDDRAQQIHDQWLNKSTCTPQSEAASATHGAASATVASDSAFPQQTGHRC